MSKRVIEYGVRTINADGDVVDVNHYHGRNGKAVAMREAMDYRLPSGDEVAVVVEREVWTLDSIGDTDSIDHEVIFTRGDSAALRAGEWVQS